MAVVTHVVPAPPDRVWAVLRDGWTYSDWVVGSVHIRDVDAAWPAPGARLHHKVGPWPVSVRDTSTVLACDEPRELRLRAGLWPFGAATVEIRLRRGRCRGDRGVHSRSSSPTAHCSPSATN